METQHAIPEQLFRRINSTPQPRKAHPRTPSAESQIQRKLAEGSRKRLCETSQNATSAAPRIWCVKTHPVGNPNKPGKIRRVANAASKFQGISLNNDFLTGPDLLANLLEIILRFRKHPVGVLVDIEGMVTQVAIRVEDQSALHFLRLEDGNVRQYQYIRLIFGATFLPCYAIFALHRGAADLSGCFFDGYEAVLSKFYMDDFIMSFATAEDARRLASNLRTVLQPGGFRLTKFVSNNPAALAALPEEDNEIIQNTTKILGRTWCLSNDTFTAPNAKSNLHAANASTTVQHFSSIFDPIGLLVPFVIQLKVILQSLRKRVPTWDEPVSDDLQPRINKFATQYATMPRNMPPHCSTTPNIASAQLCRTSHFHRRFHLRILRRNIRTSTAV